MPRPARRIGRDRQRRRAHAEGFRERIVDAHAFDCQDAHGTNSNGSGRPSACSGTLKKFESHAVTLLIVCSHPALDSTVARGLDRHRTAEAAVRDIAVANDKFAVLEYVSRGAKHLRPIFCVFVDRNIRHCTLVKPAAIRQAK